jgi:hypothetical protein
MAEVPPDQHELARPFLRHDKYGELGLAPQPWTEQLRLLLLTVLVVPIKVLGTLSCLLSFFVTCRLSFLLPASSRQDTIAALGKLHCRCCLFWLGFHRVSWIRVGGAAEGGAAAPVAAGIVSNHCGWADILIHMSKYFPAFVARDKTEHMPFVGIIRCAAGPGPGRGQGRPPRARKAQAGPPKIPHPLLRCPVPPQSKDGVHLRRPRHQRGEPPARPAPAALSKLASRSWPVEAGQHATRERLALSARPAAPSPPAQGVAARVKDYMQRKGEGRAPTARPLLLFPEVSCSAGWHACAVTALMPCSCLPPIQQASRLPPP